jgi:S1-C subfamily serine protease
MSDSSPDGGQSVLRILTSALLTLFFLLSVGLPHGLAEWSISSISERYAPAVVKITALDDEGRMAGSGSGFFVNSRGDVATNYHVLENASKAVVQTARGEKGEIFEITHADPGVDLLIAGTSFRNTLPVTLGDSDRVIVGESVLVLGNSPGWEGTLSSGMITRVRNAGDLTLLQVTARILPGGSGGPVFNTTGEVIGIATAFSDFAHFAMPVNYLRTLRAESSSVDALKGSSVKLEASLVNSTLVDVLVRPSLGAPVPTGTSVSSAGGYRPLTVYFKSGKKVLCDWVWKEGETLFLVIHGKLFAVGYDLNLIDAKRSLL